MPLSKIFHSKYFLVPSIGTLVIILVFIASKWLLENWDFCSTNQEIKFTLDENIQFSLKNLEVITSDNLTGLMPLVLLEGTQQPRLSVMFDLEGKRLASGGTNIVQKVSSQVYCGSVWVYNLDTGEFVTLTLQEDEIPRGFSFSPDGKLLAFIKLERLKDTDTVIVWNMDTNEQVAILNEENLCRLVFDPINSNLHIFTTVGQAYSWNPVDGVGQFKSTQESEFTNSSSCETPSRYSPDKGVLVTPNKPDSGYLEFVNTETTDILFHSADLYESLPQFVEHSTQYVDGKPYRTEYIPLNEVIFSPDGTLLSVSVGSPWAWKGDGAVQIWGIPVEH